MKTTRFFRDVAKNPVSVVLLLATAALMAFLIVGDIINMRSADTHYMYCENLCYLVNNISICYLACILLLMVKLKQTATDFLGKEVKMQQLQFLHILMIHKDKQQKVLVQFLVFKFSELLMNLLQHQLPMVLIKILK